MLRDTVSSILHLLRELNPAAATVGQARRHLADLLGVERVDLLDERRRPVPEHVQLAALPLDSLAVDVYTRLSVSRQSRPGEADISRSLQSTPEEAHDPTIERFIREMANQERGREFVWIGHVAKTMLPDMGLNDREAAQFIERMQRQGLISRAQYPNPNNPDRPTTGLKLNREHPLVRRCLPKGTPARRVFPIASARGEPVSETLIRERR